MTEKPAHDSAPGSAEDSSVKARFAEALARKNAKGAQGVSHADAASKIHGAHGPEAHKRDFRRKSG